MNENYNTCDNCPMQLNCANICAAMNILAQRAAVSTNAQYVNRFVDLQARLGDKGFSYPRNDKACQLSQNKVHTQIFLHEIERLLAERY